MTITFENDNDAIVYALAKIIAYAKEYQYFFVANCTWWIASIIGLDSGLVTFIDNLHKEENQLTKEISPDPRDLTEDKRLDRILENTEEFINNSSRLRNTLQSGKVNPLPQTKNQLKKARKVKRLQEANNKKGVKRDQRLLEIRATIIKNLSKE
jgi:predicted component of type VI protein secretion system